MSQTWLSGLLLGLTVVVISVIALVAPAASVLTLAVVVAAALPDPAD